MTLNITPVTKEVAIGQVRRLPIRMPSDTIDIEVVVMDKRSAFGRTDWQVSPVAGSGACWVSEASLTDGTQGIMPRSEANQNARAAAKASTDEESTDE